MSAILERARALIGVPFRLQGRDPAIGIDCIGLVELAAGISDAPEPSYRRRGNHFRPFLEGSAPWFRRVSPRQLRPGDVLLFEVARRQWHCAICDEEGFIHADAGVGRVVRVAGTPRWPVRAVLRRRLRKTGKQ